MSDLTEEELSMKEDTDVLGHIRRENEEREKRAEEEGWTFWGKTSEKLADRFDNVYEYELSMTYQSYSDMHKSKRGYRPRCNGEHTLSELREKMDKLRK